MWEVSGGNVDTPSSRTEDVSPWLSELAEELIAEPDADERRGGRRVTGVRRAVRGDPYCDEVTVRTG